MSIDTGVKDRPTSSEPTPPPIEDVQIESPRPDTDDEWDIGEILELLKNDRRREIIAFLRQQDDHASTSTDLAEHIAAVENETDVSQITSTQRKRVYVALYQFHLPKMDDFGVIDFSKHRGTVELRDTTRLEPFLSVLDDGSEPSVRMARALAVVVSVVVGIGLTGVGVLAVVPGVLWTALAVGALLLIAFTTV